MSNYTNPRVAEIFRLISAAALRDGKAKWKLDSIFKVGSGAGRNWRNWENGIRNPRTETLLRIVKEATELGWLKILDPELLNVISTKRKANHSSSGKTNRAIKSALRPDQVSSVLPFPARPYHEVDLALDKTGSVFSAIDGWSAIVREISEAAKREGLKAPQIERILECGRGDGKNWRNWLTGECVARPLMRERIVVDALVRHWLRPSQRLQEYASNLCIAAIYYLPEAPTCPISKLPHPPDRVIMERGGELKSLSCCTSAAGVAGALIADARRDAIFGGTRELLSHKIDGKNNPRLNGYSADGEAWKEKVAEVSNLLLDNDNNIKFFTKKLRAQLIAGYRRLGYK